MEDTQPNRHRRRRLRPSSSIPGSLHTPNSRLAVRYSSRKEDIRIVVLPPRELLLLHRRMLANTSSLRHTILSIMLSRPSQRRARYRNITLKTMRV